jgi:hypothetical protein
MTLESRPKEMDIVKAFFEDSMAFRVKGESKFMGLGHAWKRRHVLAMTWTALCICTISHE